METILCNSIVAEDGVVGMDGWITNSADVRIAVSACAFRHGLVTIDVYAALAGWMHRVCADLAGCYENPVWYSVRLRLLVA
mgnify:CR=1 FL=1